MHSSQGTCISMAVEFTIGVRRESKRADPKSFENTDTACSPHALPILVRYPLDDYLVKWKSPSLGSPGFNPIGNSLHGSDLLSKCSNLGLQGSLLGSFKVMSTCITKVFKLFLLVWSEVTIFFHGIISILNLAFPGVMFSPLSLGAYN